MDINNCENDFVFGKHRPNFPRTKKRVVKTLMLIAKAIITCTASNHSEMYQREHVVICYMFYVLCFMFYVLCFMLYVLCLILGIMIFESVAECINIGFGFENCYEKDSTVKLSWREKTRRNPVT